MNTKPVYVFIILKMLLFNYYKTNLTKNNDHFSDNFTFTNVMLKLQD